MNSFRKIAITDIIVGERLRIPERAWVSELAKSMASVGLLNPIVVTHRCWLVAGNHRLEAAKLLGWDVIEVAVLDLDAEEIKLAEIDENLIRNELSALERAEHLAERKYLYETQHPETKNGATGKGRPRLGQLGQAMLSFADSTAESLNESARNIRRSIAIAEKLPKAIRDQLRGTPTANNKRELGRLAKLDGTTLEKVTTELVNGARSVKQAQRSVVAQRIRAESPPLPKGPYRVLVLDPPWDYKKRKNDPTHRSSLDYPSMSVDEIAALPVPELAHNDAVLWLWTTNAFLDEAHELAKGWGFVVKTALTWAKDRPGLGDWLRGQTEHVLLCVQGHPCVELGGQSTLLTAKRREHSRKPDEFYAMVEQLPWIEIRVVRKAIASRLGDMGRREREVSGRRVTPIRSLTSSRSL